MDKLSLILISVNYGDFLSITLPLNKEYFDEIICITDLKDEETVQICAQNNVKCLKTDEFYRNGRHLFDKGVGLNLAINSLDNPRWILSADVDILMPIGFKNLLKSQNLDKNLIYGARRYEIRTYQEFLEIQQNPELVKKRFLYRGIFSGFFQLFHYQSVMTQDIIKKYGKLYPETGCNSELDWHFKLMMGGDYIYDPPLIGDNPDPFEIENNPHANQNHNDYCIGALRELPFTVNHLGLVGKNANSRTTTRFL